MELSSDPIQTGTKREPSKTKEESGGPASAGGRRRTWLGRNSEDSEKQCRVQFNIIRAINQPTCRARLSNTNEVNKDSQMK